MIDETIGKGLEDVVADTMVEEELAQPEGDRPGSQTYYGAETEHENAQPAAQAQQEVPEPPKQQGQQAQEQAQGQDDKVIDPMRFWNAQQKDFFAKQPPEAQRMITSMFDKMRFVYDKKTQEIQKFAGEMEEVIDALAPTYTIINTARPMVEAVGLDMDSYLDTLIGNDYLATNHPMEFICKFIQESGFHIQDIIDFGYDYAERMNSPEYQENERLKEQQAQMAYQLQQKDAEQEQYAEQQLDEMLDESLAEFESKVDENGNDLHPYLEQVEDTMVQIMNSTGNVNLEDLYEKACWLVPEVRQELINQIQQPPQPQQPPMPNMARGFKRTAGTEQPSHKTPLYDMIVEEAARNPDGV